MAVMLLLCHVHIGSLCQRSYNIRLSTRSGRGGVSRMVLAHIRLWGHVYRAVGVRAGLRIPNLRRSILHMQVSRAGGLGS